MKIYKLLKKFSLGNKTFDLIKKNKRLLWLPLILVVILLLFLTKKPTLNKTNITYENNVPISNYQPEGFSDQIQTNTLVNVFDYGDQNWNDKFKTPQPPENHDSIVKFLKSSIAIPGMKYISTYEAVPSDWKIYDLDTFSFKYPPDYYLVSASNQEIIFFKNIEDYNNGKRCIGEDRLYFSDDCPKPILSLLYASTRKGSLGDDKDYSYFTRFNFSKAAFYALDGREWFVSAPGDPVGAMGISADTSTSKNIVHFIFKKYDKTVFTDGKGLHNLNFRDEMYRIVSTMSIKDDTLIKNLLISENTKLTLYEIASAPKNLLDDTSDLFVLLGLDYLPILNRQIKFFQQTNSPDVFYYFAFPDGYVKTGSFSYNGKPFIIKTSDQGLLPYVQDIKYCNVDTDCSFRKNFCGVGFYNNFQQKISVYGCEGPYCDENNKCLDEYDETYKCILGSKYDGARCQNGKCVGINYQYYCKK